VRRGRVAFVVVGDEILAVIRVIKVFGEGGNVHGELRGNFIWRCTDRCFGGWTAHEHHPSACMYYGVHTLVFLITYHIFDTLTGVYSATPNTRAPLVDA
jgi:hypothetical protein